MLKANHQIDLLIENVLCDFTFVDRKRFSKWLKRGNYLNSYVLPYFEEYELNYELIIYLEKRPTESLTQSEIFLFLHEISHIIILEEIRTKKGYKAVQTFLDEYNEDISEVDRKKKIRNWSSDKAQEEYEKIAFEKETNDLALKLYDRYIRIASF